jgi:hypothetical protein
MWASLIWSKSDLVPENETEMLIQIKKMMQIGHIDQSINSPAAQGC